MSQPTYKSIKKKYYDIISVATRTKQVAHHVQQHDKVTMFDAIIKKNADKQVVVITKSKRKADELSSHLAAENIKAKSVHGNHRTSEQEAAAEAFNKSEIDVLITTDTILQTLGLANVPMILSYDIPNLVENYFIRIGHLKEVGESIAFVSSEDRGQIASIELLMKREIPQEKVEDFTATRPPRIDKSKDKKKKPRHSKVKKESKSKEA
ncbi:MAG: DEAD/DEAH box helicase [Campylobacterales bacterium]|nr:DEAD/DEAH box helicase [Campylobacterales bacterium]